MSVIEEEKIKLIAKTSLALKKLFNSPQDIEWCFANGKLWILQSRNIAKF